MEKPLYLRRLTGRWCWWRHRSRGRKILKTIKNSGRAVSSCFGDRSPPCEHRFIALARGSAWTLFAREGKLRAGAILGKTTKYGKVGEGYKFLLMKLHLRTRDSRANVCVQDILKIALSLFRHAFLAILESIFVEWKYRDRYQYNSGEFLKIISSKYRDLEF